VQAWIANLYAQSAPKLECAVAMERDGATLAEIGAALGLTPSAVSKLSQRARRDGRLPPKALTQAVVAKRAAAKRGRIAAVKEARRPRMLERVVAIWHPGMTVKARQDFKFSNDIFNGHGP
jgi:hypothetical protein